MLLFLPKLRAYNSGPSGPVFSPKRFNMTVEAWNRTLKSSTTFSVLDLLQASLTKFPTVSTSIFCYYSELVDLLFRIDVLLDLECEACPKARKPHRFAPMRLFTRHFRSNSEWRELKMASLYSRKLRNASFKGGVIPCC